EIELRVRRRRQRDLRHLVRTKLRPVLDPDLHVRSPIISLSPRRATRLGSPRHDHFTLASLDHLSARLGRRTASPRTATRDAPRLTQPPSRPRSPHRAGDRKSTRLNSSHGSSSYAVFCLQKTPQTPF